MRELVEPTTGLRMTTDEEARMVARAKQGLADIAAGRTVSVQEALLLIATFTEEQQLDRSQHGLDEFHD